VGSRPLLLAGWWSGVLVGTLALINEVNLRRTGLVLRWVTVSDSVPGAGHLFQYVTNQPPKANSAFHPSLPYLTTAGDTIEGVTPE